MSEPSRQLATCHCGCCWFQLRNEDGTEGGFSMDTEGVIGARSGDFVCRDCGTEFVPPRERFSIVTDEETP